MPRGHLHHMLDHVRNAVRLLRSARSVDVQRRPAALDWPEHCEIRQITHVVHVKMGEKTWLIVLNGMLNEL